jgi:phosphatidylethanolamine/phosphatidyl-N-methylethanolamine N-methyltransferase
MTPLNTNAWNRLRYTLYAPFYDRVVRFARPRRRSIELLSLSPGERVLIVGAGTGADLPFLPDDVQVTATDLTPAMVERIVRRARRLGRTVEARVMDAQALDYPDASFDAVILHLIVAVAPDPRAVVREAERVLVPGGRIAVFDKFAPEGRSPSSLRRVLNVGIRFFFTDITRKLGPLLEGTRLRIVHREPAFLGRAFEIALLEKR